LIFLVKHN